MKRARWFVRLNDGKSSSDGGQDMPGGSRFTDHAGEPVFILLVTLDAGAGHWTDHAACVWYSQRGGSFRCTGCARQLVAMAADCRHAKAARRAVLAGKVAGVPAPVPR